MTFNQMIARFATILNRDDCTPDAAAIYMQDSISRIARSARLPDMERSIITLSSGQSMQFLAVPPDLLQVIDIYVTGIPDGTPDAALSMVSQRQLIKLDYTGPATTYSRFQGQFNFKGYVPKGASVILYYYGEFTPFATGDSSNEISTSNPDLVIYGALSFAADVFSHPSAEAWESRYQQMLAEVQGLGIDLDANGGSSAVDPMYQDYYV